MTGRGKTPNLLESMTVYHKACSSILHLLHKWWYIFLSTAESSSPNFFLLQVFWVVRNVTLKGRWKNYTDAIWRKKNGRTACVSYSRACHGWVALSQGWPWPRGHLDQAFIVNGKNIYKTLSWAVILFRSASISPCFVAWTRYLNHGGGLRSS